jgi:hypothetical protein
LRKFLFDKTGRIDRTTNEGHKPPDLLEKQVSGERFVIGLDPIAAIFLLRSENHAFFFDIDEKLGRINSSHGVYYSPDVTKGEPVFKFLPLSCKQCCFQRERPEGPSVL